jgi:2-oxoglutarate dehydrogenase E1 component
VLGAGDVKYHLGATGDYQTQAGGVVRVHLVSNPSHLEAVNPVAMGRARAKQDRLGSRQAVLPIVIHGDSAFAGQGVVAETLNLADLPGYTVGGTLQVVVNNLIGFTTTQPNLHSSRYASDVARRLDAPVFHVNGEDPDAVVRVARLAAEYRYAFAGDVTVDLIGYRRHGHSEVDDPTVTQPICYRRVKDWPVLWESYARRIGEEQRAREIEQAVRREFEQGQLQARQATEAPVLRELPAYWANYTGGPYDRAQEVDTGVPEARLAEIGVRLASFPPAFHIHPKLVRLLEERHDMGAGRRPVDWGMAEALAFGSLLWEGRNVRMSGEDVRRGTFNHRHAVLIDTEDESEYTPLNHLHSQQGKLMIYDSCLSEMAPLGFEYGYSRDYPEALVLWEAQFGDFANGAQIIIDQFLSATEDKWDLLSAVVLLLPHGYEGQGPEHSSARLERFLQLCGEDNMQVGQPSTAAQYFHLLRRQALRRWHKPLVVMTPKSMLRNPAAMSPLASFTTGRFQPVIPDRETRDATRLLVCSGKIGHELRAERQKRKAGHVAIVFLEQFYPFPDEELAAALQEHPRARDLVWVQEEPANMGALTFVLPRIERAGERPVRSVKRSASASPATGSGKAHAIEQATLLALAFA